MTEAARPAGEPSADDAPAGTSGAHDRVTTVQTEGTTYFDASPAEVWRIAIHPDALARTMPGVERVDVVDDAHWTAHVKIPLGLVRPRLALACSVEDRREPESAVLVARGANAKAGALKMTTSFELSPAGEGSEMRWHAVVELSGRISAVGEKMLRPLVDRQVAKVMASLQEQVRASAA